MSSPPISAPAALPINDQLETDTASPEETDEPTVMMLPPPRRAAAELPTAPPPFNVTVPDIPVIWKAPLLPVVAALVTNWVLVMVAEPPF